MAVPFFAKLFSPPLRVSSVAQPPPSPCTCPLPLQESSHHGTTPLPMSPSHPWPQHNSAAPPPPPTARLCIEGNKMLSSSSPCHDGFPKTTRGRPRPIPEAKSRGHPPQTVDAAAHVKRGEEEKERKFLQLLRLVPLPPPLDKGERTGHPHPACTHSSQLPLQPTQPPSNQITNHHGSTQSPPHGRMWRPRELFLRGDKRLLVFSSSHPCLPLCSDLKSKHLLQNCNLGHLPLSFFTVPASRRRNVP
jgi:hypothetical protein